MQAHRGVLLSDKELEPVAGGGVARCGGLGGGVDWRVLKKRMRAEVLRPMRKMDPFCKPCYTLPWLTCHQLALATSRNLHEPQP